MGKKDTAAKIYMNDNEHFADALNYATQVSEIAKEHRKNKGLTRALA